MTNEELEAKLKEELEALKERFRKTVNEHYKEILDLRERVKKLEDTKHVPPTDGMPGGTYP